MIRDHVREFSGRGRYLRQDAVKVLSSGPLHDGFMNTPAWKGYLSRASFKIMTGTDENAKDIKRLGDEELTEERRRTALDFQADFAPSATLTQRYAALNEAFIRRIYGRRQCAPDLPAQ